MARSTACISTGSIRLPSKTTTILAADGYISMFRLKGGKARYKGRYVQTERYRKQIEAGRQLYGYYRNPTPTIRAIRDIAHPNRRTTANTTPVILGGKLYATKEDGLPYEIDPNTLATRAQTDLAERGRARLSPRIPKWIRATVRPSATATKPPGLLLAGCVRLPHRSSRQHHEAVALRSAAYERAARHVAHARSHRDPRRRPRHRHRVAQGGRQGLGMGYVEALVARGDLRARVGAKTSATSSGPSAASCALRMTCMKATASCSKRRWRTATPGRSFRMRAARPANPVPNTFRRITLDLGRAMARSRSRRSSPRPCRASCASTTAS